MSLWKEVKKQASSDRQHSFQELAHPCLSKIICFYFSTFFLLLLPLALLISVVGLGIIWFKLSLPNHD